MEATNEIILDEKGDLISIRQKIGLNTNHWKPGQSTRFVNKSKGIDKLKMVKTVETRVLPKGNFLQSVYFEDFQTNELEEKYPVELKNFCPLA